ncbi:hypothetical protein VaNZ11_008969 [Volvox africanus]|uniref:Uncharacterized protein n=1 Tax=Volvox africanus TaxID=51714 RepID=A0ABQ5S6Z6_9CHLO|nr:hypothetical protein VaNZ11_008969 [Volvox africanus]
MADVFGTSAQRLPGDGHDLRYAAPPSGRVAARPGRAASGATGCIGTAKPTTASAGPGLPGPVPVTVAVRATDDDNDEDTADQPSTPGRPRPMCRRDRFVAGSVRGTFHPDLYMSSQECITFKGKRIGRSRFEKLGNSSMAKWHRSIRVIREDGELEPLGEWLTRHGLPVLKGKQRISRKRTKRVPPLRLPVAASAAAAAAAAAAGYCGGAGDMGQDSSADEGSSETPRLGDDGTEIAASASGSASAPASVSAPKLGYGAASQQLQKALKVAAQLAVASVVAPGTAGSLDLEAPAVKVEEPPAASAAPMSWGSPLAAAASDVDGVCCRSTLGNASSECLPAEAAAAILTATGLTHGEAPAAAAACQESPTGVTVQNGCWDATSFAAAAVAAAAAATQWRLPPCGPSSSPAPVPNAAASPAFAHSTMMSPAPAPAPIPSAPAAPDLAHSGSPATFPIRLPTYPNSYHISSVHHNFAGASSSITATSTNPLLNTAPSKRADADAGVAPRDAFDYIEMTADGYCVPLQPKPLSLPAHWLNSPAAADGATLHVDGSGASGSTPLPPCSGAVHGVGGIVAGGSPVLLDSLCDLWNDDADEEVDNATNAAMWALLSEPGSVADTEMDQDLGVQLTAADVRGPSAAGTRNAAGVELLGGPIPAGNIGIDYGGGTSDPSGVAAAAATPVLPATPGMGCSTAACGDRAPQTELATSAPPMMSPCWPSAATHATLTRPPSHPSFTSAANLADMQRSSSTAMLHENQTGFAAGHASSPPCEPEFVAALTHCGTNNLARAPSAAMPFKPWLQGHCAGGQVGINVATMSSTTAVHTPSTGTLAAPLPTESEALTGQSTKNVSEIYSGNKLVDNHCSPPPAAQQSGGPYSRELSCASGSSSCLPLLHDNITATSGVAGVGQQLSSQPAAAAQSWMAPPPPLHPGGTAGNPALAVGSPQEDPTVLSDAYTGLNTGRGSAAAAQMCGAAPGGFATAAHTGGYPHAGVGPIRRPYYRGYSSYYHPGYYPPYAPYPAAYGQPYPPPYSAYGRARLMGAHGIHSGAAPSVPCGGGGWPLMPLLPHGMPPPQPHMYRGPPRTARMFMMEATSRGGDPSPAAAATAGDVGNLDASGTDSSSSGGYYNAAPVPWAELPPLSAHSVGVSRAAESCSGEPMLISGHPTTGETQQQPSRLSLYPYDWSYGHQDAMMPTQLPHHHPDEEMWSLPQPPQSLAVPFQTTGSRAMAVGMPASRAPQSGGSCETDVTATSRAPSASSRTGDMQQMTGANVGVGGLPDPGVFAMSDPWYAQW